MSPCSPTLPAHPFSAETPDEVATTIVPKIRRVPQDNINPLTGTINPAYIQYLTKPKAYGQILSVGWVVGFPCWTLIWRSPRCLPAGMFLASCLHEQSMLSQTCQEVQYPIVSDSET